MIKLDDERIIDQVTPDGDGGLEIIGEYPDDIMKLNRVIFLKIYRRYAYNSDIVIHARTIDHNFQCHWKRRRKCRVEFHDDANSRDLYLNRFLAAFRHNEIQALNVVTYESATFSITFKKSEFVVTENIPPHIKVGLENDYPEYPIFLRIPYEGVESRQTLLDKHPGFVNFLVESRDGDGDAYIKIGHDMIKMREKSTSLMNQFYHFVHSGEFNENKASFYFTYEYEYDDKKIYVLENYGGSFMMRGNIDMNVVKELFRRGFRLDIRLSLVHGMNILYGSNIWYKFYADENEDIYDDNQWIMGYRYGILEFKDEVIHPVLEGLTQPVHCIALPNKTRMENAQFWNTILRRYPDAKLAGYNVPPEIQRNSEIWFYQWKWEGITNVLSYKGYIPHFDDTYEDITEVLVFGDHQHHHQNFFYLNIRKVERNPRKVLWGKNVVVPVMFEFKVESHMTLYNIGTLPSWVHIYSDVRETLRKLHRYKQMSPREKLQEQGYNEHFVRAYGDIIMITNDTFVNLIYGTLGTHPMHYIHARPHLLRKNLPGLTEIRVADTIQLTSYLGYLELVYHHLTTRLQHTLLSRDLLFYLGKFLVSGETYVPSIPLLE